MMRKSDFFADPFMRNSFGKLIIDSTYTPSDAPAEPSMIADHREKFLRSTATKNAQLCHATLTKQNTGAKSLPVQHQTGALLPTPGPRVASAYKYRARASVPHFSFRNCRSCPRSSTTSRYPRSIRHVSSTPTIVCCTSATLPRMLR